MKMMMQLKTLLQRATSSSLRVSRAGGATAHVTAIATAAKTQSCARTPLFVPTVRSFSGTHSRLHGHDDHAKLGGGKPAAGVHNHDHDHDHDHDDDDDDAAADDDEEDMEDVVDIGPAGMEFGGPQRGGKFKEPTRFGDWERKGRCTDF